MAAFNPDAYLANKPTPPPAFNPDAYLAQKTEVFDPDAYLAAPLIEAEPKPEDQSFLRSVADVPLKAVSGLATGVRLVADAFGAGSDVSNSIKGVEDYIGGLYSAQSKKDSAEISRIMEDAEDKGVGEQVKAAVKAFTIAPIDTIVNALGTSAPAIVAGLGASVLGAGAAVATAAGAGVGTVMGAGTIKGTIYDAVKEELGKTNMPKEQIEARAQAAQDYNGENLDQILMGSALGAIGASTGFEPAIARQVAKQIIAGSVKKQAAVTGAKEFTGEAAQGGQEQLAENIALQREGYDVPTMRGVVGQATLEGLAGAGLGAAAGASEGLEARRAAEVAPTQEPATTGQEQLEVEKVAATLTQQGITDIDPKRVAQLQQVFQSMGLDPGSAQYRAIEAATKEVEDQAKEKAPASEEAQGEQNVGQTISDTSGAGVQVAGQPDTDITPAGVRVAEPDGMVPAGQDVAGVAGGEAAQPVAVTKPPIVDERGAVIPATEKGGNPIAYAGFKTLDEDNNLSSDLAGATFITGMDVPERNKGVGTQLLNSITNWADENGKTLVLVPAAQPDPSMGGLSQEQLKEWYARNGF
jgi:GNAT superfamily N-acetyltransferase